MASSWPTSIDSFTNPTASEPTNSPSHSGIHTTANGALTALETVLQSVGLLVNGGATVASEAYVNSQIAAAISSLVSRGSVFTATGSFSVPYTGYALVTIYAPGGGGAGGSAFDPLPTESTTLTNGSASGTTLTCSALPIAVASGDSIVVTDGAGNTQTFTTTAAAAVNATNVHITSATVTLNTGSGYSFYDTSWTNISGAAGAAGGFFQFPPQAVVSGESLVVSGSFAGGAGGTGAPATPGANGTDGAGGGIIVVHAATSGWYVKNPAAGAGYFGNNTDTFGGGSYGVSGYGGNAASVAGLPGGYNPPGYASNYTPGGSFAGQVATTATALLGGNAQTTADEGYPGYAPPQFQGTQSTTVNGVSAVDRTAVSAGGHSGGAGAIGGAGGNGGAGGPGMLLIQMV